MPASRTVSIHDIQPHLRLVNLFLCPPDFNSGERRLYDHYLLYVHQGKGRITIAGRRYEAETGDLYFCPPGLSNTIEADGQDPFLLSGIDFDFMSDQKSNPLHHPVQTSLYDASLALPVVHFTDFDGFPERMRLPGQPLVRALILDMAEQFRIRQVCHQLMLDGQLKTLIAWLVRLLLQDSSGESDDSRRQMVIRYIADHFRETLTNRLLAEQFHYHPDTLNRIVLRYTGVTLKQYIIDLRIQAAVQLLQQGDATVSQVAEQVGYQDCRHFSRVFKQRTGRAPGLFRRLSKNDPHSPDHLAGKALSAKIELGSHPMVHPGRGSG